MGLAPSPLQKTRSGWNVWPRVDVSQCPQLLMNFENRLHCYSICVISLRRVLWLKHWNLTDLTYIITPGACWSVLEPTLGVVNTCLPTIQPVSRKVFNKDILAWSKANRRNSTLDRVWKLNRTGPFSFPHDSGDNNLLRLKDLQTLPTKPQISEDHPVVADYRMRSDVVNTDRRTILVTKTWDIESVRDGDDHV